MMQNESCSIIDQRFLYEKYESEFEEGEVEGILDLQQIELDLFNHIVWASRIRSSWGFLFDCIERPIHWDFSIGQVILGKQIIYDEEDIPKFKHHMPSWTLFLGLVFGIIFLSFLFKIDFFKDCFFPLEPHF